MMLVVLRLLMVMMLVVLLRLVMLVVLMVVVAIICWGWTVDNSQARTAVVHSVDRERAAAVFIVSLVSMSSMSKLSVVVIDRVEGSCLLLVVDCCCAVVGFWIKMDGAFHVLQLRCCRHGRDNKQKKPHRHIS